MNSRSGIRRHRRPAQIAPATRTIETATTSSVVITRSPGPSSATTMAAVITRAAAVPNTAARRRRNAGAARCSGERFAGAPGAPGVTGDVPAPGRLASASGSAATGSTSVDSGAVVAAGRPSPSSGSSGFARIHRIATPPMMRTSGQNRSARNPSPIRPIPPERTRTTSANAISHNQTREPREVCSLGSVDGLLGDHEPRDQVDECADAADEREEDEAESDQDRIDAEVVTEAGSNARDDAVRSAPKDAAWVRGLGVHATIVARSDAGANRGCPPFDPEASRCTPGSARSSAEGHPRDHRTMQASPSTDVRRRLVRPKQGRRVAGVAAGMGNAFGIDPNLIRIAFIVLAFASGVGIVLYLIAWFITPSQDSTAPSAPPRRQPARSQFVEAAALAVIVFGVLLLVRPWGFGFADQIVWPVMLAGFGAALVWGRFRNPPAPSLQPNGHSPGGRHRHGVERGRRQPRRRHPPPHAGDDRPHRCRVRLRRDGSRGLPRHPSGGDRGAHRGERVHRLRVGHRPRLRALAPPTLPGSRRRATRPRALAGTRGDRGPRARLGAPHPGARPPERERSPSGREPRPPSGARAADVAGRWPTGVVELARGRPRRRGRDRRDRLRGADRDRQGRRLSGRLVRRGARQRDPRSDGQRGQAFGRPVDRGLHGG